MIPPADPPERFDARGAEPDPLARFERWWSQAREAAASTDAADSMALATVDPSGRPAVRMVILRGFDQKGFVFFTHYESPKARDLATNAHAALVFHWVEMGRQVRVTGTVERLSREDSDSYFRRRPRGHRLAAWASPQSDIIEGGQALHRRFEETEARFAGGDVPLPPFWGGLRVVPETIEFWQGRENRLHDRVRYSREGRGWRIVRLAP